MIEINLSTGKKAVDLTSVGGIDLSKLNVKYLLLAIIIAYVPDFTIFETWEAELAAANVELTSLNTEKSKFKREVDALQDFDKQIQALNQQEEKLKAKLEVVKAILNKRQNPWEVLVYVAKNIPSELWLSEIRNTEKSMVFRGQSLDYTPQGVFLENIKKSVFFEKNVIYNKVEPTAEQKNLAPFEISATIVGGQ